MNTFLVLNEVHLILENRMANLRQETSSELKKTNNDAVCQSVNDKLNTHMCSVGALISPLTGIGTVFVVGTKYVMTAWHVVRGIIKGTYLGFY